MDKSEIEQGNPKEQYKKAKVEWDKVVEQGEELREKALLDLYGISSEIDNDPIPQKKRKLTIKKLQKNKYR